MTESRAMFRLAAPLALQQVGHHVMGLVDTAMLGRYSDAAIAGAGVGNNLYFFVTCVGLGIVMGLDTVVPQALGGGRSEDARRAVGAGMRLALLVGLASTLLVLASPLVLIVAGVEAEVVFEARAYTYMRALGAVPFLISIALRSYLAAHSITRPLVLAVVIGNLVNVALDYLLIFGVPAIGLPALGVVGAAISTTVVQTLMLGVFVLAVRTHDRASKAPSPRPASTRADMLAIVRYGLPVGGQLLAEVGIFGIATVLAARLGKVPAAGHAIALGISSFTFSFALGVASATSVRVGHAVGAGDLELARRRGLLGLRLGLCVMAAFAALFVVFPATFAGAFSRDATVIAATVPLLQLAALFQLSDGAQTITAGALRGLGETRATLTGNLLGHYVIGLPLIVGLAFAADLGAPGLWSGLVVGLTATAIYLIARFLRSTSRSRR
jgi:multidrug resistance protein, MATE family